MTQIKAFPELILPHGGKLVNLITEEDEQWQDWKQHAAALPSVQLSPRAICDLELLATGAFSPLDRFLGEADYRRVLAEMRLVDGTFFPIPLTLPLEPFDGLHLDQEIVLRGLRNQPLAILRVEEIYRWDYREEAQQVFGTLDTRHPVVSEMTKWGPWYVTGTIKIIELPTHYDFVSLRLSTRQTRACLGRLGFTNVIAFQTRNPMHRSHEEMTKRAMQTVQGALLIHPTVGITRPDDVDYFTRIRCIQALVDMHYESNRVVLSILPLAMRLAGPKEALWHMIVRKNYGANHFIVGRDHASPGKDSRGVPFYDPYAAQHLARKHESEIGVKCLTFSEFVYLPEENRYEEMERIGGSTKVLTISGTEIRENYLQKGKILPEWYTRPEVGNILLRSYPPKQNQGFCIWFTGLPSAGKSTIADVLIVRLSERGRRVTLLDGDVVRTHLSKGLGFSREDRDANILRIGFVSSEIVRHNGTVICAAVSPYRSTRDQVRSMFENRNFVEVFVDTPLETCEQRDVKGLYGKARRGEIKGFTGIDDPYEIPTNPEIVIQTLTLSSHQAAARIIDYLENQGFFSSNARNSDV